MVVGKDLETNGDGSLKVSWSVMKSVVKRDHKNWNVKNCLRHSVKAPMTAAHVARC
jgi:hypothetical protein